LSAGPDGRARGVDFGPAEELTPAPTAAAAGPTIGMGSGRLGRIGASWPAAAEALDGRRGRARREGATGYWSGGSLMRHTGAAPGAVGPLAVAVIEAALRALLVPLAGGAETPGAALPATRQAAVDVAAIARGTEEEGLPAQAAGPHQEDLHGPTGPEMSGWAGQTREGVRHLRQVGPRPPRGGTARGPGACSSRLPSLHRRGCGTLPENRLPFHSLCGCGSDFYAIWRATTKTGRAREWGE
jgi:hypothetical protein